MMSESKAGTLISNCFFIAAIVFIFCSQNCYSTCLQNEKEALSLFKQDLEDDSGRLSSWLPVVDCCKWEGIVCDNATGHVMELRLHNPGRLGTFRDFFGDPSGEYVDYDQTALGGNINPSLLNLTHLIYIDLSSNGFGGTPVPSFIGSLQSLEYLNFSQAGFGRIPHHLGNLSNLHTLDLRGALEVDNLSWLASLSNLENLDLSQVNLKNASDWLHEVNMVRSLRKLQLSQCGLDQITQLTHLNFSSLTLLDLSFNDFKSTIPRWVFSLSNLLFLDLSFSNFEGLLPEGPWNVTSLTHLNFASSSSDHYLSGNLPKGLFSLNNLIYMNLGGNKFQGPLPGGIRNLSSLQTLDVPGNLLNSSLPHELFTLRDLVYLNLMGNRFEGAIPSDIANLSSLTKMDLSYNAITEVPREIGKLCNLVELDLSSNKIQGSISELIDGMSRCSSHPIEELSLGENYFSGYLTEQFGKLKSLRSISLDVNTISGPIPSSIGELSSLQSLGLSRNKLNGTLPKSLAQLSRLLTLEVSDNIMEGEVNQYQLFNLTSLRYFYASRNSLQLKVNPSWTPLGTQIVILRLGSWKLESEFPLWLQSLSDVTELDLSSTGISGAIPSWFLNFTQQIRFLNLSHNHLSGEISSILGSEEMKSAPRLIYLSSNKLSGSLPRIPSNTVTELDLSNNSFSGDISSFLCDVEEEQRLEILNLGRNLLSGEIPNCWKNWPSLKVINLANNNLTGRIPRSIGYLKELRSLDLQNNSLSGQLPLPLKNCKGLLKIDLGHNYLSGNVPSWVGSSLPQLRILILRSNQFHGDLSPEVCFLSFLRILDIAENSISGNLPSCLKNFTAMTGKIIGSIDEEVELDYSYYVGVYLESASVAIKGNKYQYDTILALFTGMDLSNNNFSGDIPEELTSLVGLRSLNLSGNHLGGMIPRNIGDMRQLESLDLSRNLFSGEISSSISALSFLNFLNLSYNNLSGRIPVSTQMQSFNASCFIGNKLCGLPLTNLCSSEDVPLVADKNEESEVNWLYIFMASGYVVGLWGVLGILVLKGSWRHAYFRFVDNVWIKLYLLIK